MPWPLRCLRALPTSFPTSVLFSRWAPRRQQLSPAAPPHCGRGRADARLRGIRESYARALDLLTRVAPSVVRDPFFAFGGKRSIGHRRGASRTSGGGGGTEDPLYEQLGRI